MASRRNHLILPVLLAVYLVVALTYGLLYPLGEAPDEVAHVDLIRFIGDEGHLPQNYAERQAAGYKSDSPMLYHTIIGLATSWVDYNVLPRLKVSYVFYRRLLVEDGLSPFALIHTDDEALPYRGVVLAWHVARMASTLISAGTLVVVYITVLTICPDDHWLALGVTAATAAIPQFHFIASAVNDDNLLGLLLALFTLTLVRAWQRPERRWPFIWLGLWFGLALTTKYTGGLFLLLVLVVLARAIWRGEISWHMAANRLLIFGVTSVIAAAWWFIYVELYFNQVEELGLVAGLVKPLNFDASTQRVASLVTGGAVSQPGPPSDDTTVWDWATMLFRSFWFMPNMASAKAVKTLSWVFAGLCCFSLTGLGRAWRRGDLPWPILGLLALQIGLLLPFPLLRFYLTLSPEEAGQGRHILFPAAAAVGLLLTLGVSAWFPPTYRRFVGLALAVTLLILSLVSFIGFVLPTFPTRLPIRTSTDAVENIPNPVNVPFGDAIELIGYEVGEINQYGALPVTLVWSSRAYADNDYIIDLKLTAENGREASRWLGHPVNGRYPTRAWDPGDVIRDTIWLPARGVSGGDYRLTLRVAPHTGGSRWFKPNQPSLDWQAFELTGVTLSDLSHMPPAQRWEAALTPGLKLMGYDLWPGDNPGIRAPHLAYRATVPLRLVWGGEVPDDAELEVTLGGHPPLATHGLASPWEGKHYLFFVGPDWKSSPQSLRVAVRQGDIETEYIELEDVATVTVRPRNFDVPPMPTEVHANFGNEITLLGFDFPERRVKQGNALPLTLYWKAQRPMSRHYIVSNHLLNKTDLRQWGGRDRVPQAHYSTILWTPGEVVRDEYLVPVDPSAPPGVYRLDIGLYTNVAGQAWQLPLVSDGEVLDANSVTIAPIKVGGPPPGITIKNPSPQHPRADNLEGLVTLLGYDWGMEPEMLRLTLYWRCDAPLPADYTTFVHVRAMTEQTIEQPGAIVAQMDRPPADGAYPTSLWDPGEVIRDSVRVPIPSEVSSGEWVGIPAGYEIVVGLYDFAAGRRLLILDDQGQPISDYIRLGEGSSVQ